jgi:hypothetical protein
VTETTTLTLNGCRPRISLLPKSKRSKAYHQFLSQTVAEHVQTRFRSAVDASIGKSVDSGNATDVQDGRGALLSCSRIDQESSEDLAAAQGAPNVRLKEISCFRQV